jgi:hypothetical protein
VLPKEIKNNMFFKPISIIDRLHSQPKLAGEQCSKLSVIPLVASALGIPRSWNMDDP